MRLLVVTPFAPRSDAAHGGARALAATIVALGSRHELGVVHFPDSSGVDAEVRKAAAFVTELPAPNVSGVRRLRVYRELARGAPMAVGERVDAAVLARLHAVAADFRPELVQLEFLLTTALLPAIAGIDAPRVLVDHDATLRPLEQFDTLPSPLAGILRALDARAWRRLARRAAAEIDAAIVFTERDRAAGEFRDTRIVPLVVPPRGQPLDANGTPPPTLLFVGYYRHPPNEDAAAWLVDEIFPGVRRERPEARLVLAGDELPAAIAARAGAGVEFAGRVETLDPLLERAAIVVAPLRTGGGTRVKVLEALGAGKAVVATPRAAEGIAAPAGDAIVIAEGTEELVREISALLVDDDRRRRIGAAAYAWATKELDGRRTADSFDAIYADVLRSR